VATIVARFSTSNEVTSITQVTTNLAFYIHLLLFALVCHDTARRVHARYCRVAPLRPPVGDTGRLNHTAEESTSCLFCVPSPPLPVAACARACVPAGLGSSLTASP
jgi:hypothetical protein